MIGRKLIFGFLWLQDSSGRSCACQGRLFAEKEQGILYRIMSNGAKKRSSLTTDSVMDLTLSFSSLVLSCYVPVSVS